MFSLTVRATAIFAMALAFLVLSPGGHASAAPVMVNGPWAAVFSTDAPLLNAGDCPGGIEGTDPARNSPVANPWNCYTANNVLIGGPGVLKINTAGSPLISGSIFGGGLTVTFTGTLSSDGKSATGNWSSAAPETGVQCGPGNTVDDDGDGFINDGCPQVDATAEAGLECANATDDDIADADGVVNDGCLGAVALPAQKGTFRAALATHTTVTPAVVTDPNAGPPGSGGANLTFEGSTSLSGDTAIITAPTSGGPVPPQFKLEGQFYHVITTVPGTNITNAAAGKFIFCAGYVEDAGSNPPTVGGTLEGDLQILHWNPGAGNWDPPNLTPRYKSVDAVPYSDAVTNVVCAEVDHLSEFALVGSGPVGGLVSIVAGDSSAGVSTWLWASIAGAIALATAGGWIALGRRRLH